MTNINITPWSTSLALTDSDVEATLARIPGLARSPELSEIVDVLMSLIKKAHSPIEARIEAKPMTSSKVSAIPPRIRSLKVEVPMHYRREKEEVVKMGLKPMEAHLLNTRPGGPGPLIQSNENAAAMPAIPQPLTNQDKLKTSLLDLPMRCGRRSKYINKRSPEQLKNKSYFTLSISIGHCQNVPAMSNYTRHAHGATVSVYVSHHNINNYTDC